METPNTMCSSVSPDHSPYPIDPRVSETAANTLFFDLGICNVDSSTMQQLLNSTPPTFHSMCFCKTKRNGLFNSTTDSMC